MRIKISCKNQTVNVYMYLCATNKRTKYPLKKTTQSGVDGF